MASREKQLYAVFHQVRTCFNQLKALAEQLHQDLGVNPSMRAIMESLENMGPQAVPNIARTKSVTRQHIQNIMNALQAKGLVEPFSNPAHKRSQLFDLTLKGRATFKVIQEREKKPLCNLVALMSSDDLEQTEIVLKNLNRILEIELSKGESNDKSSH